MYNAGEFQIRYEDHKRQMAWVNGEGWKFDPPATRRQVRETIARALVTIAARFAPAIERPRTAV